MQFFSHEGFDLAFIDHAAGERWRTCASHPRICLDPHGQLGFARLDKDAERRRLSRNRLRQSRPWRVLEELRYGRLYAAEDGRRCGSASRPPEIDRAHVMGYSMGARISAFLALAEPEKVATLVFGGLGQGMVDGVGDWDPIAAGLLADDPDDGDASARQGLPRFRRPDKERPQGAGRLHCDVAGAAQRNGFRADHPADADRGRHQGRHLRVGGGAWRG